jgi:flagellin
MARINTNVAALGAQLGLSRSQKSLNDTLTRLSSGLRINSGADDPAGLIASEGLRSEIAGINQAVDNSSRASNVIATAEGALGEVSNLLLNIKSLIVQGANAGALSNDELQANQLQIDSAIESVTRISNTTSFAGLKLLDGNLDYVTSGVNTTKIADLSIKQANFGTSSTIPVNVNVLTSAKPAQLNFTASAVHSNVTLEIRGTNGVSVLTFTGTPPTTASAIANAVNGVTQDTGVTAALNNPANPLSGIKFDSTDYGSKSFVSVTAQAGAFAVQDPNQGNSVRQKSNGVNATATINGALTTGDGRDLELNTSGLNLKLTLDKTFGVGQTSFSITGGGALFQLGTQVSSNQQVNLGIQSIAANHLGDSELGFLNDLHSGGAYALTGGTGNITQRTGQAGQILDFAINQIAVLRGRLGAFEKNVLQTNSSSLQVALENVTSAESSIRDADFATETSNLTRAQILTQAGTSVLATANSTPQSVLKLLQ